MLWLIDVIGGFVLLVLLFSTDPWVNATDAARKIRLRTGSLVIGILLGIVFLRLFPKDLPFSFDPSWRLWLAFGGIPLLVTVVILFLERLRKKFVT
jgi:hypothetical protein